MKHFMSDAPSQTMSDAPSQTRKHKAGISYGGPLAMAVAVTLTLVGMLLAPMMVTEAQGGVTGYANLRITNFYRAAPRPTITVTDNMTPLNTSGTFTRLTAAGAVGVSGDALVVKPAGTLLYLVNVGSNTITFTETGTLISAGNIALGAGDTATLISDGTNWRQLASSNN
jgi:hypothetical protein